MVSEEDRMKNASNKPTKTNEFSKTVSTNGKNDKLEDSKEKKEKEIFLSFIPSPILFPICALGIYG